MGRTDQCCSEIGGYDQRFSFSCWLCPFVFCNRSRIVAAAEWDCAARDTPVDNRKRVQLASVMLIFVIINIAAAIEAGGFSLDNHFNR